MLQYQYLAAAQQTMQRLHASESALDGKGWRLAVVLIYARPLGTKCSHDVRRGYKRLSPTFTTWLGAETEAEIVRLFESSKHLHVPAWRAWPGSGSDGTGLLGN